MNASRLSRRALLARVSAAALVAGCADRTDVTPGSASPIAGGPVADVDPFIGTGGHGHTYPGVSLPFGMAQISPDTDNTRWDSVSGYHLGDPTMLGFSHTHLSGTGVGDMLDVLLRPGQGTPTLDPGSLAKPQHSYRARYTHADEFAEPGYYRVRWPDEAITTELTASERCGMQRFVFERDGTPFVLVDFAHGMQDHAGMPTRVSDARLTWDGHTLTGTRVVHQWADGRVICFALQFDQPPTSVTLFSDDQPAAARTDEVAGRRLKAICHFAPDTRQILARTGLSSVDIAGAAGNLAAEMPDWDFGRLRARGTAAWNDALGKLHVQGGTPAQRQVMTTALYHAQLGPTLISDADGRYRGLDRQIHVLPAGRKATYSTYSIWDTYRAEHPLLTLLAAERVPDIVQGLVDMLIQGGGNIPRWPLQDVDTECMTGHHAASIVAEAINKGFTGIDLLAAWPAFRRNALAGKADGMGEYRRRGWIPADRVAESTTLTVEYCFDDWALSQLATLTGHDDDARLLKARSHGYRALYDRRSGFVRPRLADGRWAEPFAPNEMGHWKRWRDFTEANAWQATFLAQHDVYGMIAMMGGAQAFDAKLDAMFAADPALPPDAPPDIAGQVGQYAHGNEPSHHIAYLYAYVGKSWKTQDRVRMLQTTMYAARPDGLAGNEDVGQMSAWFILSALGFYPVDPTAGLYVFGSPLFEKAELAVGGGRRLVIEAPGAGDRRRYIQSVRWNGAAWTKSWIPHRLLAAGGTLSFEMGERPNTAFGAAPADRPPCLTVV